MPATAPQFATVATLTVKRLATMPEHDVAELAAWLERLAADLRDVETRAKCSTTWRATLNLRRDA